MYLLNCRHRICFDCVGKRVAVAVAAKEHPYCQFPRCANRLTKNDFRLFSCRTHMMKQLCDVLMPKLVDEDDIIVFCSVVTWSSRCCKCSKSPRAAHPTEVRIRSMTPVQTAVPGKGGRLEKLDMKTTNKKQINPHRARRRQLYPTSVEQGNGKVGKRQDRSHNKLYFD